MKNFYDMLSLARDAPADDIKKAFRREIARYHPDKVQHLGREFQEMASGMAADLTEAYRILMDPALRAKYDEDLSGTAPAGPHVHAPPTAAQAPAPPRPPDDPPLSAGGPAAAPQRPSAGTDFVKRVSMQKLRDAIAGALPSAVPLTVSAFDIAVVVKPKKGLFKKAEDSLCLMVKFVPQVDPAAIEEFWPAAAKVRVPDVATCVLLLVGQGMAPARELSAAITDLRRRARTLGPVLVPVDVRDWEALFPPDTPAPVRDIVKLLKDEQR